eukprot:scaffold63407_cov63-Phaeocystis_antarctica.AAC.7
MAGRGQALRQAHGCARSARAMLTERATTQMTDSSKVAFILDSFGLICANGKLLCARGASRVARPRSQTSRSESNRVGMNIPPSGLAVLDPEGRELQSRDSTLARVKTHARCDDGRQCDQSTLGCTSRSTQKRLCLLTPLSHSLDTPHITLDSTCYTANDLQPPHLWRAGVHTSGRSYPKHA